MLVDALRDTAPLGLARRRVSSCLLEIVESRRRRGNAVAACDLIKFIDGKLTRIADRLTAVLLRHFDFSTLQGRWYAEAENNSIKDLRQRRQQTVGLRVGTDGDPQIIFDARCREMTDDYRALAQACGQRRAALPRMTREDEVG